MDSGLHGFIATVEISMLMFPLPHSSHVHNGTITNINLCINEFLIGFGSQRVKDKITFCHQVFL